MSAARAGGALRPLEAFEALARFARRRGDVSFRLAMHAAVPQSFRPELLHLLKLNFVPEAVDDPAEADVLLAPFTADLGGGYFQFDPEARRLLLDYLGDTYGAEPVLRARRVADFLLRYVERAERHSSAAHDRLGREFLETQRWVGLAFARPEEAAEQLAGALKAAEDTPELGARLHLGGLAHAVTIPLAHHRDLLNYALGLQALESGETDTAEELLDPLLDREITAGRVTLQPRRSVNVVLPAAMVDAAPEEAAGPGAERAYRVFISGTLLDLKEYREAAAEVCEHLGLVPVRWETLSAFAASPYTPAFWDSRRVDLLLCLVGERYGYVPPHQEWSGTEAELNHARSRGIDVLPFFMDTSGPVWRTGNEEIRAFRQRILAAFSVVPIVHSPEEFRASLAGKLENWIRRKEERQMAAGAGEEFAPTQSEPPPVIRRLFLSYDRTEQVFARRLYGDLASAGFEVWMDTIDLVPGTGLWDAIRSALLAADGLVLVATQHTPTRASVQTEWSLALASGKPVFPVLRAGSQGRDLPKEFTYLQPIDFREELQYPRSFAKLLQALGKGTTSRLGHLYHVPPLASVFVGRHEIREDVKKSVLDDESPVVVLRGPPGIGKTTLAVALAHDGEVRRRFPDGVLWFPASRKDEVAVMLATFLMAHKRYDDESEAGPPDLHEMVWRDMQRVLADGAYLVILDDVSDPGILESLASSRSRSGVLATARDAAGLRGIHARTFTVSPFTAVEAAEFLAAELDVSVDSLPPEARQVAEVADYRPLALKLGAALVRTGTPWSEVVEALHHPDGIPGRGESLNGAPSLDPLPLQASRENRQERAFSRSRTRGDGASDAPVVPEPTAFPDPVLYVALEPRTKVDQDRMSEAIRRLLVEDPTFRVHTDPATGQTIISGMGELHLEILVDRMAREFKVDASVGRPQVAYRETIRKAVEAVEGRYVHQRGAGGHYGHVVINMMPAERGQGFVFEEKMAGGVLPREFIDASKQGLREAMHAGVLAGLPMVDVKVQLVFGTYQNDSSGIAFRIAASMAFKEAARRAGPVLLEPMMSVEVATPSDYMADVMSDLSSRHGKIRDVDSRGEAQVIDALVPLSEMLGYSTSLRVMSQGRAVYSMQFAQYEEVPTREAEKIVASAHG